MNDILDIESDRVHCEKRNRPIASGAIPIDIGWCLVFFLIISAYLITLFLNSENKQNVFLIITVYYIMNIAYCFKLKHFTIIDVFVIAIGFVFRVLIGGLATNIFVSQWIILMTFLLALFLGFAKRRDDVVHYSDNNFSNNKVRKNLNSYNLVFLNQTISVISSVTIVCYIIYTVSDDVVARIGSNYLWITSIFVIAAIIRYLQITIVDVKSGSPTKVLLYDHFLQCCLLGWGTLFFVILYL